MTLASEAVGVKNVSKLLRLGLASLAGVDAEEHEPPTRGWPKGKPRGPRKVRSQDMAGVA